MCVNVSYLYFPDIFGAQMCLSIRPLQSWNPPSNPLSISVLRLPAVYIGFNTRFPKPFFFPQEKKKKHFIHQLSLSATSSIKSCLGFMPSFPFFGKTFSHLWPRECFIRYVNFLEYFTNRFGEYFSWKHSITLFEHL